MKRTRMKRFVAWLLMMVMMLSICQSSLAWNVADSSLPKEESALSQITFLLQPEDATLTVTDEVGQVQTEQADGYWLADGEYHYTAALAGYETQIGDFSVAGESQTIAIQLTETAAPNDEALPLMKVENSDEKFTSSVLNEQTVNTYQELSNAVANYAEATSDMTIIVAEDIELTQGITVPGNDSKAVLTIKGKNSDEVLLRQVKDSILFSVSEGANLVLQEITLDGNSSTYNVNTGSLLSINGGEGTLNDGAILQNNNIGVTAGAGVTIISGDLFIEDGAILTGHGGSIAAVQVNSGAKVVMNGGSIKNNDCGIGGAVYVNGGTFTMNDGEIRENNSARGGAAYIQDNGSFVMDGGLLYGNTTKNSKNAGVYLADDGSSFVMNSGIAFGQGTEPTAVVPEDWQPEVSGDGIVIRWEGTAGGSYHAGSSDDLMILPDARATAVWAIKDGENGITYTNGSNTGFLPVNVLGGSQPGEETPLNVSLQVLNGNAFTPGETIALTQGSDGVLTGELPVWTSTEAYNATGLTVTCPDLKDGESAKLIIDEKEYPFVDKTATTGSDVVIAEVGEYQAKIVITDVAQQEKTYVLELTKADNDRKIREANLTTPFLIGKPEFDSVIGGQTEGTLFQIGPDGEVTANTQIVPDCYEYQAMVTADINLISINKGLTFFKIIPAENPPYMDFYVNGEKKLAGADSPTAMAFAMKCAALEMPFVDDNLTFSLVLYDKENPNITSEYQFHVKRIAGDIDTLPQLDSVEITGGEFADGTSFQPDVYNYTVMYEAEQEKIDFALTAADGITVYQSTTEAAEQQLSKGQDGKYHVTVPIGSEPPAALSITLKDTGNIEGTEIQKVTVYKFAFQAKPSTNVTGYYEEGNKTWNTVIWDKALLIYKNTQEYAVLNYQVKAGTTVAFEDSEAAAKAGHVIEKLDNSTGDSAMEIYQIRFKVGDTSGANPTLPKLPKIVVSKGGAEVETTEYSLMLRSELDGVFTPDVVVRGSASVLSATGSWNHFSRLGPREVGNYEIYKYDEPIQNDPNNPYGIDFVITGNRGTGSEPGAVAVSQDGETWYYLAGQQFYELSNKWETRNVNAIGNLPALGSVKTPVLYSGNSYPPVDDFNWGYVDVAMCADGAGIEGTGLVTGKPRNPYAENAADGVLDIMDISWAVDDTGKPVHLDEISYIRIQNVIDSPNFGGLDTEIGTIVRTDNYKKDTAVGVTEAPETLTVAGVDILKEAAKETAQSGDDTITSYYEVDITGKSLANIKVDVKTSEDDTNIYVNKARYTGEASYQSMFAGGGSNGLYNKDGELLVRILVQQGELEPRLYVVRVVGGDPEAALKNTDLESVFVEPGDKMLQPDTNGEYSYEVSNAVEAVKLTVKTANEQALATIDGANLNEGGVSNPLALKVGENTFTIQVKSQDGTVTKDYTIRISRKAASQKPDTSDTIQVYFTFTGDVIHGTDAESHEAQTWIEETTVEIPKNSTVKYLTDMMLLNHEIEFHAEGGTYIDKVKIPESFEDAGEWLAEFTNGSNSGWMYRVNGYIEDVGYADYILKNGDKVKWFYTDDYTKETNYRGNWGGGGGSQTESKDGILSVGVGGKVTPDDLSDYIGKDVTIQIQPDAGYQVKDVVVDGKSVGAVTTYTYENLKKTSRIQVTFEKIAETAHPFTDVSGSHWAAKAIDYVYEKGLMTGVSTTEFEPNGTLSRAMLVTVLYRMAGEPETSGENPFSDVTENAWYTKAVLWANGQGIVSGYGDGSFGPDDAITREQLAAIFYRHADLPKVSGTELDEFTDAAAISEYAQNAMLWAVQQGIVTGKSDGMIDPMGNATRAEAATIIYRYLEKVE